VLRGTGRPSSVAARCYGPSCHPNGYAPMRRPPPAPSQAPRRMLARPTIPFGWRYVAPSSPSGKNQYRRPPHRLWTLGGRHGPRPGAGAAGAGEGMVAAWTLDAPHGPVAIERRPDNSNATLGCQVCTALPFRVTKARIFTPFLHPRSVSCQRWHFCMEQS
jgi:hypothetical protein